MEEQAYNELKQMVYTLDSEIKEVIKKLEEVKSYNYKAIIKDKRLDTKGFIDCVANVVFLLRMLNIPFDKILYEYKEAIDHCLHGKEYKKDLQTDG